MKYIVKKTLTLIITLLIVSFLAFLAFQVIPGDPTTAMLGTQATPERIEALRASLGLDDPLLTRYARWLYGFARGDMGISYSYSLSVVEMLADKIPITAALTLIAVVLIVALSVPLGIYLARKEGTVLDRAAILINQVVMAIPPFFAGIFFTLVFGLILKLFTPGNYVPYEQNPGEFFIYMFFPALSIALPRGAMTVKLLRGAIVSEMDKDYVRTAYSRGLSRKKTLYRHVLRNAAIPTLTFLAVTVAEAVAGSIIVEQVFSVPGIGRLLLTSIANRDFPVVQAIIVLIAAMVIVINFAVDLLYQVIDPRIRME